MTHDYLKALERIKELEYTAEYETIKHAILFAQKMITQSLSDETVKAVGNSYMNGYGVRAAHQKVIDHTLLEIEVENASDII